MREAQDGARIMGLTTIAVLDHPDTMLSSANDAMIADIEKVIAELNPTIIFTHSEHDQHQDHAAVHRAVLRAARQHTTILCFESPSATRAFTPSVYIDIHEQLETKAAAVEIHRDQASKPYMSSRRVHGLAAFRGSQGRVVAAEAFEPVRYEIPFVVESR